MKRCKVCNKRTDNGTKYCQRCGTAFKYDPRVSPFSETKISLVILTIIAVVLIVTTSIPLKYPDPTECSRTSYTRFKRLAKNYYLVTKNVLRQEVLFTSELSELRRQRNDAETIAVPSCLEPAKADLVNYLDDVYYIALYSVWGYYRGAAVSTENAGFYWDSLNSNLDQVKECLPNCP